MGVQVGPEYAIYIAYRQWRTADDKLKHELFDRRFSVYDAARTFLVSIAQTHESDKLFEAQRKFVSETREAKWLLNTTVADYLHKECYGKSENLRDLLANIESNPNKNNEPIENQVAEQQQEIMKWFFQQNNILDDYFSPFLKLQHPLVCGKLLDLIKKN